MTAGFVLGIALAVILCIVGGGIAWVRFIERRLRADGTGSDDGSTGE